MSLPIEYFTDQTHITDLEKLQYEKLYYIIRLFRNELEKFKLKGLIIVCNEIKDFFRSYFLVMRDHLFAFKLHGSKSEIQDGRLFLSRQVFEFWQCEFTLN